MKHEETGPFMAYFCLYVGMIVVFLVAPFWLVYMFYKWAVP